MRTVLAFALTLVANGAAAQTGLSAEAARHLERGNLLMTAKRYDDALAEYRAAYAIESNVTLLYNIGQALRLGGHCEDARRAYEAYLDTNPPAERAQLAHRNIAACEATAEPLPPAPVPAPPVAIEAAPEGSPWYHDLPGNVLAVTGSLLVVGGTLLWLQARGEIDDANVAARQATTWDAYATNAAAGRDAESRQTVGITLLVAGGATLTGALVRYALRPDNDASLSATPLPGGGAVMLSRRF
jgi:tetratricopeptide (TPR) repeat protein